MTSQLQARANGGLLVQELIGPPDFSSLSMDSSNMTAVVAAGYGDDVGFGQLIAIKLDSPNAIQRINVADFLNTTKRHTLLGRYSGIRFMPNSAVVTATTSACKYFFQHPQSNTGTNSIINTSGGQLVYFLQAGQAAEDGTLPSNYAGLLITVTNAEVSFKSVAAGAGSTQVIKLSGHASTTFQVGTFFGPVTDGTGDLGAAANRFNNAYFKTLNLGGTTGSYTHTLGSGNAGTDDGILNYQINGTTKWRIVWADNGVAKFQFHDIANSRALFEVFPQPPTGDLVNSLQIYSGLQVNQFQAGADQDLLPMYIRGGMGYSHTGVTAGNGQDVEITAGDGGDDTTYFTEGGDGGNIRFTGGAGRDGGDGGDVTLKGGAFGSGGTIDGKVILESNSGDFVLIVDNTSIRATGIVDFTSASFYYSTAWQAISGATGSVTAANSGVAVGCSHTSLCTVSLPTPTAGMTFTFIALTANGLKLTGNSTNTIIANGVVSTPTTGYIQLTQYSVVHLIGISNSQWLVLSSQGVITVV